MMQKSLVFLSITLLFVSFSTGNLFFNKTSELQDKITHMAEYKVILREGIVGGFAGPTVKQVVDIQGDNSGAQIMHAFLKPESNDFNTLVGGASTEELSTLLETLKKELGDLPTEDPVGSEDIYGQDISLAFFSDDFQWSNGGPEGCSQGESKIKATDEQKEKFKELVELVQGFGQQYAVTAAA